MTMKSKPHARRQWNYVFSGVVAVLTVLLVYNLSHSRLLGQLFSPKPVPYTVKLRSTAFDAEGRPGAVTDYVVAVRGDGSRLLSSSRATPNGPEVYRFLEFADGERVQAADAWGLKSSMRSGRPGQVAQIHRSPGSQCGQLLSGHSIPGEQVVGEETVAGYRAAKVVSGGTTTWYALDHGCAEIKSRSVFGKSGSNEKALVELLPGEPAASLFALPDSLVESPPSRIRAEARRRLKTAGCGPDCEKNEAREDERYLALRSR